MEAPRRGMMRGHHTRIIQPHEETTNQPQPHNQQPQPQPHNQQIQPHNQQPQPHQPKDKWIPKTKLGRLVLSGKITTIEQIVDSNFQIREPEIVDKILGLSLKSEIMKIKPVRKHTRVGERTRFKAVVCIGDLNGHVGLGIKTAAEVANAIKGATIYAKLAIIPVRRGYWGNKIGNPHTVPSTFTGKCGSIRIRLIPAPRGTGIVAGSVSRKLLSMAGFEDVFTSCIGNSKTTANFMVATYKAMQATYQIQGPTPVWPKN